MTTITHPRFAVRRSSAKAGSWWGRAWVRGVEEAAYSDGDLKRGRQLARAGSVGAISVGPGRVVAAVVERDDAWTVTVSVPQLDDAGREAFVEVVAAEAGRIAALVAGDLPHTLVEHAEEAGVELLPYGAELACECNCDHWTPPCPHAIAVLSQFAWLLDEDPFVLLGLRGLPRDELLAALHDLGGAGAQSPESETEADLDSAADAVRRARALLLELGEGAS
ncbi:hypothetical protein NODU109028_09130 [Nocardioides dubius]|uniref:SWIM-type domain-containing protein n=1 Tax=Nocardioides dubius TaxID=317019 RepID=A0ABN1TWQ4_9ACTN